MTPPGVSRTSPLCLSRRQGRRRRGARSHGSSIPDRSVPLVSAIFAARSALSDRKVRPSLFEQPPNFMKPVRGPAAPSFDWRQLSRSRVILGPAGRNQFGKARGYPVARDVYSPRAPSRLFSIKSVDFTDTGRRFGWRARDPSGIVPEPRKRQWWRRSRDKAPRERAAPRYLFSCFPRRVKKGGGTCGQQSEKSSRFPGNVTPASPTLAIVPHQRLPAAQTEFTLNGKSQLRNRSGLVVSTFPFTRSGLEALAIRN